MSEKIKELVKPNAKVVAAIGFIGSAEWCEIQSFTDTCIYNNPSTRALMDSAIEFKKGDAWEARFDAVIDDYGKLKADSEVFETKVMKEMLLVAGDLCEYSTQCKTVYTRLSAWMYDFPIDGIDNGNFAKKFETLASEEWGKKAGISPAADQLKTRFTRFLGQLQAEALEKQKRVDQVSLNLDLFENSLKTREASFRQHKQSFNASLVTYKRRIEKLGGDIKQLQMEIVREEQKDYDKIMVLKTAPVYLIIPVFGPFIMAAVLLGVGIATGVLRKQLGGLIEQAEALEKDMGAKVTQMRQTEVVANLITETIKDIELIKPEIKKLSKGWGALADEVGKVVKYVSGSLSKAELGNWDASGMDLENATSEWMNVYKKADSLRMFSTISCTPSLEEAIKNAEKAA